MATYQEREKYLVGLSKRVVEAVKDNTSKTKPDISFEDLSSIVGVKPGVIQHALKNARYLVATASKGKKAYGYTYIGKR